jgi:hypothetical protein
MNLHRRFILSLLVAALVLLALAGCRAGQAVDVTGTAVLPTATAMATPLVATTVEAAYPYPEPGAGQDTTSQDPTLEAYPGPGGPGAVSVRPNLSMVTARLIEAVPEEANPDTTRLHVEVLATEAIEADLVAGLVGQEVDLYAETASLPDLEAGDTFTAEVQMLGDEWGQRLQATNIVEETQP